MAKGYRSKSFPPDRLSLLKSRFCQHKALCEEVIRVIRKVKEGYRVLSESGRNMGTYATKEEAKKRLRQIEFFKHKKKK